MQIVGWSCWSASNVLSLDLRILGFNSISAKNSRRIPEACCDGCDGCDGCDVGTAGNGASLCSPVTLEAPLVAPLGAASSSAERTQHINLKRLFYTHLLAIWLYDISIADPSLVIEQILEVCTVKGAMAACATHFPHNLASESGNCQHPLH